MRTAVVLFNLGGPDSPEAVRPFLTNLFSDPAIIGLPWPLRIPLAHFVASRRTPVAYAIYARLGGRSPILSETEAQARALETALAGRGHDAKCFIAMRYWHPRAEATARAVKAWAPDRIVLLPLYPQFSTTTSASSLAEWIRAADGAGLTAPVSRICCFPDHAGLVDAQADLIAQAFRCAKRDASYRVLFSAHGLPERVIAKGDPYRWQVERTAAAVARALARGDLDWTVCYQSRVGPLRWIGPATHEEIRRAGAEGKGVIVVPIAFVSEHSETLVELDEEYAELARGCGVPDYIRVPALRTHPRFIAGLGDLVERALSRSPATSGIGRLCPADRMRCGFGA